MSLHSDDRTELDTEDDREQRAEIEADAERITGILAPVLEAAERAARKLIAARVTDPTLPGFENQCGWQEARRLDDEALVATISAEVRGAFTAWLTDELKARLEQ